MTFPPTHVVVLQKLLANPGQYDGSRHKGRWKLSSSLSHKLLENNNNSLHGSSFSCCIILFLYFFLSSNYWSGCTGVWLLSLLSYYSLKHAYYIATQILQTVRVSSKTLPALPHGFLALAFRHHIFCFLNNFYSSALLQIVSSWDSYIIKDSSFASLKTVPTCSSRIYIIFTFV